MNEEDVFSNAIEKKTPEERDAYLDAACAEDLGLRERVEALLAAHENPDSFLKDPVGNPAETIDYSPVREGPGAVIGRYKLREEIGKGGMGVVYVAEQEEPVRRKVALKIIKPGMDTSEVIARFEAERQALALMDHPNIAKVLDAGSTESGRPYFVMELVRGIPIAEYCDKKKLSIQERLDLFVRVCQAVQHAHQKGVIHRDIKPTNVLVADHDGKPVPKVIDFGVAKATNRRLTERTIYTRFQQMIGTPMYMSPEQAEFSGLDVDTRSDIYSLGVLLYELLTGATPFDKEHFATAAYDEIRRIIREEDPPKPSTKISVLGETATEVSVARQTDPKKLHQVVRGDLDWIVMKAMEKDRTRRYDTAAAFAADVQRHIDDEPIEARPPSTSYRVSKFVRRNKGPVAAASALVVALAVGTVAVSAILVYALHKKREAEATLEDLKILLLDRALMFAITGDIERAQPAIRDAAAAGVTPAWEVALLGLTHHWRGDPAKAQDYLSAARTAAPNDFAIEAAYRHSLAGHEWGRFLGESEEWKDGIGLTPIAPVDFLFEAMNEAWFAPSHAIETLERAGPWCDTTCGHLVKAWALANSSLETTDPERADQCADQALDELIELRSRVPDDNGYVLACELYVRQVKARVLRQRKREDEAANNLARANEVAKELADYSASWHARRPRASFLFNIGDQASAVDAWIGVMESGATSYDPIYFAACLYGAGEENRALEILRRNRSAANPLHQIAEHQLRAMQGADKSTLRDLDVPMTWNTPDKNQLCAALSIWLLGGDLEGARHRAEKILAESGSEPASGYKLVVKYIAGQVGPIEFKRDYVKPYCWGPDPDYYIGLTKLIEGDPEGAKEHFKLCVDRGVFLLHEYSWSKAILERMRETESGSSQTPPQESRE